MNNVLQPFLRKFVLVFFDDILMYSSSGAEHLQHVRLVLDALRSHSLYVKHSKCYFGAPSVTYLGHVIYADVVTMDSNKVATIESWPEPPHPPGRAWHPRSGRATTGSSSGTSAT